MRSAWLDRITAARPFGWAPSVALAAALSMLVAGCAGPGSASPGAVVRRYIEAGRAGDEKTAIDQMGGSVGQLAGMAGPMVVMSVRNDFPPGLPYAIAQERVVGQTAYVTVVVRYSAQQLADIRKPPWPIFPYAAFAQSVLGTFTEPFIASPPRLPSGPIPASTLEAWLRDPPSPAPPEITARAKQSYTAWSQCVEVHILFGCDSERRRMEAAVEAAVPRWFPRYAYEETVARYHVARRAHAYTETYEITLQRISGQWKITTPEQRVR